MASKLGQVLVELNNIHPFREGNGRTQRVFLSQLALQAGFELSFVHMTEVQMRLSWRRLSTDALAHLPHQNGSVLKGRTLSHQWYSLG